VSARTKGASVSSSSFWGGFPVENGAINGPSCWGGATYTFDQWFQYTFNTVVPVVEVQTQGCKGSTYRTFTYSLKCSQDGVNWTTVEGGKIYNGNTDSDTIVTNKLASPVYCKALRIYPVSA
jgi:hypothetical protein